MNALYSKYFLNGKYKYNLLDTREVLCKENNTEETKMLNEILTKEKDFLEYISTPEELNNLFLGINIRNELLTLKQQMIKLILLNVSKNENSVVKVSSIKEKKYVRSNGGQTLRLIIREINGIAPVVMHCNKKIINGFLRENNISPIPKETDEKIARFAKSGKVGIHFVLDEKGLNVLEDESVTSVTAKRLNDIMYRGETEDER